MIPPIAREDAIQLIAAIELKQGSDQAMMHLQDLVRRLGGTADTTGMPLAIAAVYLAALLVVNT